jgi:dTDP-4-amino-4,6-dideoxygalactose transaminase
MIRLAKPWITDSEKRAVAEVLDSGWLAEGEKVAEFEKALAEYVGVKHAVVVPNATLGLTLALKSLRLGAGLVGVPGFTHPATKCAVLGAGQSIHYFDVSHNGNVDGQLVAEFCDKYSPVAIMPVSWGGTALDSEVYSTARSYGAAIVEDCACGLGAINESGQLAGSAADVSVVSFHPRKIITTGEGGALLTDRDDVAKFAREAKNFGGQCATNLKMSDLNAGLGLAQLRRIEDIIEHRRLCAKIYTEEIERVGMTPWYLPEVDRERRVYQSYCVEVPYHRDRIIPIMRIGGIETQVGSYYINAPGNRPLLESYGLSTSLLTLPINPELTPEDISYVIDTLVLAEEALSCPKH